jgi:hypothetical protein
LIRRPQKRRFFCQKKATEAAFQIIFMIDSMVSICQNAPFYGGVFGTSSKLIEVDLAKVKQKK